LGDEKVKIEKIEILDLALPMIHSFETSFGKIENKHTVIVKAYDISGIIGYGEAPALNAPLYNYETSDTCMYVLEKFLGPMMINKKFDSIEQLVKFYHPILGHNFAKAGLQNACWHILAQKENKSLKQLIGGVKDKIPVGESLGIKSTIEDTLNEVDYRLKEGYRRIKVKIKPGWDINVISVIRNKYPDIDLMVDGNSAYTLADLNVLMKLDNYNLTMIEQPLAHDDIIDHATLQKQIKTPICLDVSITSPEDARKAIEIGACKIINIKPPRVGGLLESKKIHDICQEKGVGVWCGGMLESGIGRAFNIAVASLPNNLYPADMSPYHFFYKEDLIEPSYEIDKDGYVDVPDKPGLGFDVDEDRIKKYTKRKVVLS